MGLQIPWVYYIGNHFLNAGTNGGIMAPCSYSVAVTYAAQDWMGCLSVV